jgi:hypothetical protein
MVEKTSFGSISKAIRRIKTARFASAVKRGWKKMHVGANASKQ